MPLSFDQTKLWSKTVTYASYIFVSAFQASASNTHKELNLCPLP